MMGSKSILSVDNEQYKHRKVCEKCDYCNALTPYYTVWAYKEGRGIVNAKDDMSVCWYCVKCPFEFEQMMMDKA